MRPTSTSGPRSSVGAHIGEARPPAADAARRPEAAREAVGRPAEPKLPGADREWVPKLEVPKGGGAIKATGEKLESIAFTGSASYSIPIATSPGRGGAAPQLALGYSSGAGNGPFGTGWSLLKNAELERAVRSSLVDVVRERSAVLGRYLR